MLRKEQKTAIIDANRTHEGDTGSPEVQVADVYKRQSLEMASMVSSVQMGLPQSLQ